MVLFDAFQTINHHLSLEIIIDLPFGFFPINNIISNHRLLMPPKPQLLSFNASLASNGATLMPPSVPHVAFLSFLGVEPTYFLWWAC